MLTPISSLQTRQTVVKTQNKQPLLASTLRFGSTTPQPLTADGAKGIWLTTELYHPALPDKLKGGGLSQVSGVIPWQLKDKNIDLRVMVPFYKPMEEAGFQKAELPPVEIKNGGNGKTDSYELWWKDIDGVVVYAIKSPAFSEYNDLNSAEKAAKAAAENEAPPAEPDFAQHSSGGVSHSSGGVLHSSGGASAGNVNRTVFKFNQAAAAFMPQLDDLKGDGPRWKIQGGADVNFFNDWLSSIALSELKMHKPDYLKRTTSVFYVHNTYNPSVTQFKTAKNLGISIPKEVAEEYEIEVEQPDSTENTPWLKQWLDKARGVEPQSTQKRKVLNEQEWGVSPLNWGLRFADMVVMNQRFKETNLHAKFPGDPEFVRFLWDKESKGRVQDMHHAVSDKYNPYNNAHLQSDGYTELPRESAPGWQDKTANSLKKLVNASLFFLPERMKFKTLSPEGLQRQAEINDLKQFKATNKAALQEELGLSKDPNAVIYSSLARANDPRQKGLYQLMNTVEKFATENPHAQFVLGGGFTEKSDNPIVAQFVRNIQSNPTLKDRFHFYPGFVDQKGSFRLLAGSDFMFTASTYEPYCLTQLEPMAFGALPLVTPRDGLYATVYDPHVLPSYNPHPSDRNRTAYGQTGYMIDLPDDGMPYLNAIDNPIWKPTDPAIRRQNEAFLKGFERSYQDAQQGKHLPVALNAMEYVSKEHNAEKITELYVPVFEQGLALKQEKAFKQQLA
jgi:hypothetical protein